MRKLFSLFISLALLVLAATPALAVNPVVWDQGFEIEKSGWFDSTNGGYGTATRVPSNTNGITSASGAFHAEMSNYTGSAPFSRFDGYRSIWPGTWIAEIDVYLDPAWNSGSGFDYSVAANGSDNAHQRDFIFHVTKDTSTGELMIAGSNNTNFGVREDLENINHFTITQSGWYKLRHTFRDNVGFLAVDLQLVDMSDNILWTETRSSTEDAMSEIGGNRYSWFTVISEGLNLAVDNHQLRIPSLFVRTGVITAPTTGQNVYGNVNFSAYLDDDDTDPIEWAVRRGTCAAATNTVFGNVDTHHDVATINQSDLSNQTFSFTGNMSGMELGMYCFVYNPTEDGGESDIRQTVQFNLVAPPATNSTVHIFKFVNGVQATIDPSSANGVSFPMFTSTYNAPFSLRPAGWTAGDEPYEASTSPMALGASYKCGRIINHTSCW